MRFWFWTLLSFAFYLTANGKDRVVLTSDVGSIDINSDTLQIINQSDKREWFLGSGAYDSLRVDVIDPEGSLLDAIHFGWAYPARRGRLLHALQSTPIAELTFARDTILIVIHRLAESDQNLTSIPQPQLLSGNYVNQTNNQSITLIAFISGILLALAAYNLLLYFSVRDLSYLFYVARETIFLLLWLNLYEYTLAWFWPESPYWNKYSFWLNISIYGILTISFSNSYLEVRKIRPEIFFYSRIAFLGYGILAFIGIYYLSAFIYYNFLVPFLFALGMVVVIRESKKADFRPLKYYNLAFSFFLVGVFISILSRFYILPINFFTQHAVLFGVLLEALLFSIGLADRINLFKAQAEERKHQLTVQETEHRVIRENLEEKELLLKEIHHRVKNNLQLIYSLLNLQKQHIKEPQSLQAIENSQMRVKSMSLVHQRLYESEDLKEIDLSSYLRDLISHIIDTMLTKKERQHLEIELEKAPISLDAAIPLGLIINELIYNACKYGMKNIPDPHLQVGCQCGAEGFRISIRDSGPGIPELEQGHLVFKSLGLQLVYDLVRQLKGKIKYSFENGACFLIEIPNKYRGREQDFNS